MMRCHPLAAWLLLAWTALFASAAQSHTRSESFSSWLIDGARVHVSFTVSDIETKRVSQQNLVPDDKALIAYLAPRIGATADGKNCAPRSTPQLVTAQPGYRRIEIELACLSPNEIILRDDALFEKVPTHVNLAQIRKPNGDFVEQLFTANARTLSIDDKHGKGFESAGFLQFVAMGIMHIFTGLDHQSFLLGLVLISRRLRDLVFIVTGFTLGHSLTLALAVTGLLRPHAEFIDALVALTIILIGIDNVTVATRKPYLVAGVAGGLLMLMWGLRLVGIGILPPALLLGAAIFTFNYLVISGSLRDAGRQRLLVTLVFGLIHGFGFASDLLDSKIPTGRLAELLVGFNAGVEIGQLTLVAGVTLLVLGLTTVKLTLPRPIVVDCAAALLVGVGMAWFVSRSFA